MTERIILDKDVLHNPNLSWEAKGFYAHMLANAVGGKFDVKGLDPELIPLVDELVASGHFKVETGDGDGSGGKAETKIQSNVLRTKNLSPYEKMVYMVIRSHIYERTGEAYPGLKQIAEEAGMSDRKARYSIRTLEEKGFLKVEFRNHQTNAYTLLPVTDEMVSTVEAGESRE